MGMGSAPCSGYVLEATEENFNQLNANFGEYEDIRKKYQEENPDDDFDDFIDYLFHEFDEPIFEACPNKPIGQVISIFLIRYESEVGDRYDDLSDGYYFAFDEEDLYSKTLSEAGQTLKDKGILPEYCRWTQFG